MFGYTAFTGNRFARQKKFVSSIVYYHQQQSGDLSMLHGLELLIPSSLTGTGNFDIQGKIMA